MTQGPLVIVPEIFRTTGGVQNFSKALVKALDEIYGAPVPVVSLLDSSKDFPEDFKTDRWIFGCGKFGGACRKLMFLFSLTIAPRTSFVISAHPNPASFLMFIKKLFGKPYFVVVHGIDAWTLGKNQIEALKGAKQVLAVSRYTADMVEGQLGKRSAEIRVLHNTVDGERFSVDKPKVLWRNRLGISNGSIVLLTVARLTKSDQAKGHDLILESLPDLIHDHPNLVWVLAGKGDDLERIQGEAAALGISDYCRFPGFVDDAELADLYRSADIFILPSRKEGFGIVFIEAAACGVMVIAGNQDGSVDAVADGELGLLIDPTSKPDIKSSINRAIGSLACHDRLEQSQKCLKRFGFQPFTKRLNDLLEESFPS